MLPSQELQGGDQSPLLCIGVGFPDCEPASGPHLILWPFLVSWPVPLISPVRAQLSWKWERWLEREPRISSGDAPLCSFWGSSALTWPSHQSDRSKGWHGWNLAGAYRNVSEISTQETKHHIRRAGELRFITPAGPEELTLRALSPEQRGYRVFIHGQEWLSGFVGLQGLGNCKEQDKGEWDKPQFLVLWVPTFWDLHDLDFARSKLSYRGRRRRK